MEKILVMNPGSTSTKIAVYQDETPLFVESIEHSQDELKPFENIIDQYEMRKDLSAQRRSDSHCIPWGTSSTDQGRCLQSK